LTTESLANRRNLAEEIRAAKTAVAVSATDRFLTEHPDWIDRYGELARRRGEEDAAYHVDFLAAAVEAGAPGAFADYARWAARVLNSRGIEPRFLIENLEQVRAELVDHVGAGELIDGCVRVAVEAAASPEPPPAEGSPLRERDLFRDACLGGSRATALGVAREALSGGLPHLDLYADVIEASQHEIGRLWAENRISVAQEHLATAVCQYVVSTIFAELPVPDERRGKGVVLGVEGELHQIGAQMVADGLEADGWSVRFLGTNVPRRDALDAIQHEQPQLVGVSVTLLGNLASGVELIESMRALDDMSGKVVVGGRAFHLAPGLAEELDAALISGVREAVEFARTI
jgi:MerR family transcriptional regulator, light-induced transcriptional regulator